MIKHNQDGGINVLLLPFLLVSFLLVGSLGFGYWAFAGRQDYKLNVDKKISSAVEVAKEEVSLAKNVEFSEKAKLPLKQYEGPQAYGSIRLSYPKTWSGYVDSVSNGSAKVDGFFNPGVVPSLTNPNSTFALRVQVLSQDYSSVLTVYKSLLKANKVTINPYALPKVPSIVGVRVDGQIKNGKTGIMIVLPLRDKTIQISTEGSEYAKDFESNILPNVSFSP